MGQDKDITETSLPLTVTGKADLIGGNKLNLLPLKSEQDNEK